MVIYKLNLEGIQYEIIDTSSFMLHAIFIFRWNWYVFIRVCYIECLDDVMSSKVLYFNKGAYVYYVVLNTL